MFRKFVQKYGNVIASFSLLVGVISTTKACRFIIHQPKVPEKMKELIEEKRK